MKNLPEILKSERTWIVFGLLIAFLAIPLRFASVVGSENQSDPRPKRISQPAGLVLGFDSEYLPEGDATFVGTLDAPPLKGNEPISVRLVSSTPWVVLEPEVIEVPPTNLRQSFTASFLPIQQKPGGNGGSSRDAPEDETNFLKNTDSVTVSAMAVGIPSGAFEFRKKVQVKRPILHPSHLKLLADSALLSAVLFLLCVCLVYRSSDTNHCPSNLRIATAIAILVALPSSCSNALTLVKPFWTWASVALVVLLLLVVVDFKKPTGLDRFRRFFAEQPVFRIIVLLTVAGAFGGFGYHLVTNQLRIELPTVAYLGLHFDPTSLQNSKIDGTEIIDINYPSFDKSLIMAQSHNEAMEMGRSSTSPKFSAVLTAFFAGVVGDILIGIIAANAIHLLVSGLMYHDIDPNQTTGDDKQRKISYLSRQNLTVISLGILAGFTGPKLLPLLAANALEQQQKEIAGKFESSIKEIKEEVKDAADDRAGGAGSQASISQQTILKTQDLVKSHAFPYLKFNLPSPPESSFINTLMEETNDPKLWSNPSVITARMYCRIHNREGVDTIESVLNELAGLNQVSTQNDGWVASQIMAAIWLSANGASESAIKRLEDVREVTKTPWLSQIATLNLIWIKGEEAAVDLYDLRRIQTEIAYDLEALFDQTRITLSLYEKPSTGQAQVEAEGEPEVASGDGAMIWRRPSEFADEAQRVFDATALYLPERWAYHIYHRSYIAPKESQVYWESRDRRVLATLRQAMAVFPEPQIEQESLLSAPKHLSNPLARALMKIAQNEPDWGQTKATQKISEVIDLLKSTINQR